MKQEDDAKQITSAKAYQDFGLMPLPRAVKAFNVETIVSTSKALETTVLYWGYIGIMEKKMETTLVYWGYIGIMEKKMETTIDIGVI